MLDAGWISVYGALGLIGVACIVLLRYVRSSWHTWQTYRAGSDPRQHALAPDTARYWQEAPVQEAPPPYPMPEPPADLAAAIDACRQHVTAPYVVPVGWYVDPRPACLAASFVDDTYHILISGQSRAGKDTLALSMLLALAVQYSPQEVQVCIIDGKGLDFVGFAGLAHTWRLALEQAQINATKEALTQERTRRTQRLQQAGVSKWETYRGTDLPLLVVYISELSLLEDALGRPALTAWLNSELAAGAALGIRYIIATQTVSNFDTRWRSQISLYLAGFQPSQTQDQPNTGLSTHEIRAAGGVPPSALPAPPAGAGIFTAVSGGEAVTVRAGLLDDAQRQRWLARLPAAPAASHQSNDDPFRGNGGTGTAAEGPEQADSPRNGSPAGTGKRGVSPGSAHPDAETAPEPGNAGNGAGNGVAEEGNHAGNAAAERRNLSDAEIRALLAAGTSRRQIVAQMKGRRDRNLERVRQLATEVRSA
jgi:hypothetical protein